MTPRCVQGSQGEMVESFERDYLVECLRKNNHNISRAAKQAGIDRKSVQRSSRNTT